MNASGCGAMVKEYAHHLRNDPATRNARRTSWRWSGRGRDRRAAGAGCARACRSAARGLSSAVHAAALAGPAALVEQLLADLGFELQPFADKHLCCGSAGAYSVLNPDIALELRDRKLSAIAAGGPDVILSANIGCIGHLQSGTDTPVRHWVEVVDELLRQPADGRRQKHSASRQPPVGQRWKTWPPPGPASGGPGPAVYSTAFTMSSSTFLASPNTIMVRSM